MYFKSVLGYFGDFIATISGPSLRVSGGWAWRTPPPLDSAPEIFTIYRTFPEIFTSIYVPIFHYFSNISNILLETNSTEICSSFHNNCIMYMLSLFFWQNAHYNVYKKNTVWCDVIRWEQFEN